MPARFHLRASRDWSYAPPGKPLYRPVDGYFTPASALLQLRPHSNKNISHSLPAAISLENEEYVFIPVNPASFK